METVCKDSAARQGKRFVLRIQSNRSNACSCGLVTVSGLVVGAVLGQPLQVVPQQQLVPGDPLDRFQHVVLQGQAAAHLLALEGLEGGAVKTACSGLFAAEVHGGIRPEAEQTWTCMSWVMLLKAHERSFHTLTSSTAWSKFRT